jgi:hypothetical protein
MWNAISSAVLIKKTQDAVMSSTTCVSGDLVVTLKHEGVHLAYVQKNIFPSLLTRNGPLRLQGSWREAFRSLFVSKNASHLLLYV